MANDDMKVDDLGEDWSLDDIEDMPGFAVFPNGAYLVECVNGMETKKIGEHPAEQIDLKLIEAQEISEVMKAGEQSPKPGDISSLSFMKDNKMGLDSLKKFLAPIAERLGTRSATEIRAGIKGMQLLVVLSRTYDKEKDRHYQRVKNVVVI